MSDKPAEVFHLMTANPFHFSCTAIHQIFGERFFDDIALFASFKAKIHANVNAGRFVTFVFVHPFEYYSWCTDPSP